jgi:hypothetical protein
MKSKLRPAVAIVLSGLWINISEFFRNQILLNGEWVSHYRSLGLVFPSEPVNGILWMVWGFVFAGLIFIISRKYSLLHTFIISWTAAFVMMWIVLWNLSVLPMAILPFALPLSLLEAFLGSYICIRISPKT